MSQACAQTSVRIDPSVQDLPELTLAEEVDADLGEGVQLRLVEITTDIDVSFPGDETLTSTGGSPYVLDVGFRRAGPPGLQEDLKVRMYRKVNPLGHSLHMPSEQVIQLAVCRVVLQQRITGVLAGFRIEGDVLDLLVALVMLLLEGHPCLG